MAEVFLQVVAEGVLKKVDSLDPEQIPLFWGFQKELTCLRESLTMIRPVLRDAERRQSSDEGVKVWLKRLKDVAYEADDVLDEFAYEILRRKLEIKSQIQRKVWCCFSFTNSIAFRHTIAQKIQDINTSVQKIHKDAIKFGLDGEGVGTIPPQVPLNRESDSFVDTSRVVGREQEASEIVKMLVDSGDQEALSIIPIKGIGGLGKTALAKLIYNDERIDMHFDVKIWLCVSDNFVTKRLLIEILQSLKGERLEAQELGEKKALSEDIIFQELEKELGEKKYLLILDHVRNDDPIEWEEFRSWLLRVNKIKGNNIIVTTRKQRVASIMGTHPTYHLKQLSDDQCWSLLKQRAFADTGAQMTPELETIGINIAKKCFGVPLAANVLGGMLFAKKEIDEWLQVEDSLLRHLDYNEHGVLGFLKLSFDNLPHSSLKICLAYCSFFPHDCNLERARLIQLWMAVGFLQPYESGNMLMEDIGNEYFNILSQHSFFYDLEKDDYDNVIGCRMHHLIHDLASQISRSEIYSWEYSIVNVIPRVRHLALRGQIIDGMLKEKARYLHSLFSNSDLPNNIADYKCLRVLTFDGVRIKELPNSIGTLIHLRYLELSNTKIEVLPVSICKLLNLQTLRLDMCLSLKKLPDKLSYLINMRHLHLNTDRHHFKIPAGIGGLVCLQTLSFFSVGQVEGHQLNELSFLKDLRGELEIRNLEQVSGREEAERADLYGKTNLYELRFVWSDNREGVFNDEDVLEGLKPHPNIKSLSVSNFLGDKFPTWMMKMAVSINGRGDWLPLDNLMKIKLKGCKRCEHIPIFGRLQNLRYLALTGMNNVTRIDLSFGGHRNDYTTNTRINEALASFPVLISFTLKDMPNLEEWMEAEVDHVMFPRLEKLKIESCPKLTTFPSRGLLQSCTSLRSLRITNCNDLISLPELRAVAPHATVIIDGTRV